MTLIRCDDVQPGIVEFIEECVAPAGKFGRPEASTIHAAEVLGLPR